VTNIDIEAYIVRVFSMQCSLVQILCTQKVTLEIFRIHEIEFYVRWGSSRPPLEPLCGGVGNCFWSRHVKIWHLGLWGHVENTTYCTL